MNVLRRNALKVGLHATVLAIVGTTLAGCATPPPPPPPPPPAQNSRETGLAALGFEKTPDGFVLNLPGPLLFETGSNVLSEGAKERLQKLAYHLKALDIKALRLFGHTDNVGSAEMNITLSLRRAEAVAAAMASFGFAAENLERKGFGFERPLASNDTPEGRAKNRRVAVIVPFE